MLILSAVSRKGMVSMLAKHEKPPIVNRCECCDAEYANGKPRCVCRFSFLILFFAFALMAIAVIASLVVHR